MSLRQAFLRWRLGPPVPPTNVRLLLYDGREIPADCMYAGIDPTEGVHAWTVVAGPWPLENLAGVSVDVLPRRTSVGIPVVAQEE
jgi:hypothetical protein